MDASIATAGQACFYVYARTMLRVTTHVASSMWLSKTLAARDEWEEIAAAALSFRAASKTTRRRISR
jgi:hypothetical protein